MIYAVAIFSLSVAASTATATSYQWQCLPGINTPVRRIPDGDVECAASKGRVCMWQTSAEACDQLLGNPVFNPAQPLSCGNNHKDVYGYTGYTQADHWCSRAAKMMPESPGWQCIPGVLVPLRVNHDGDVECMADNRHDCYWQGSLSDCQRLADNAPSGLIPLVCGNVHNFEYGITGYDTTGHWCQGGSSFFGLKK